MDTLIEVSIIDCGVEIIYPDAFRGLFKLRVLRLVGTRILRLEVVWLINLPSLKELIVWGNRIDYIDDDIYDLLPYLEVLDVSRNKITQCPTPTQLSKLRSLRKIFIDGNPFHHRGYVLMIWYLYGHRIEFVPDWGLVYIIEDCLAHEFGTKYDDGILNTCVRQKSGGNSLVDSRRVVYELSRRVTDLESNVSKLNDTKAHLFWIN